MRSFFAVGVTLATVASRAAAQLGNAIIVNACDYEVTLNNVPSDDGVHEQVDATLQANGGTYSQQWTALANDCGWSLKLTPPPTAGFEGILQFEYTYHDLNNGYAPLSYDVSFVNGNPWLNDWMISSSNPVTCAVNQSLAYMYSTDNSNGMQHGCSDPSTSITVTLCKTLLGGGDGSISSSQSASVTEYSITSSPSPSSTYSTPSSSSSSSAWVSTPSATSTSLALADDEEKVADVSTPLSSPSPTTFATATSSSTDGNGNVVTQVVTDVATEVATEVVTAYAHGHHPRHAHHARHHQHDMN